MDELEKLDASKVEAPARVLVGEDNRSHIVDAMGGLWCEEEQETYDDAPDVDCPACIAAFHEEMDE